MDDEYAGLTPIILKIQISQFRSDGGPRTALVYNEDRTIQVEDEAGPTVLEFMGDSPKKYIYAFNVDGQIHMTDKEAPPQAW